MVPVQSRNQVLEEGHWLTSSIEENGAKYT